MPPRKKKVQNTELNIPSEQDSEEEVSRREEEEERMREMDREEEMRLRKEEEEQDLAGQIREAKKESEKQKDSGDESEEDEEKRKHREREEEYHKEGSSKDRQSRWDRDKEERDSAERENENEFHRVINSNEDLKYAIDNMDSKRKEMKIYESQINKRIKDIKMRKTITAADIHYERVRFEEGYDKHVDKCKDQVDAIIKVQGLSRVEKYIVKRSTGDMKEAIYKSYDCFTDNFNEKMREIEKDIDKTTSHPKERSTTTFPVDDWRPNSTL